MSQDSEFKGYEYSIGIDPGWKNLGFALVRKEYENPEASIELVHSQVLNPTALLGLSGTCKEIEKIVNNMIPLGIADSIHAKIERYVPYNNVFNQEAENITLLIGALHRGLEDFTDSPIGIIRAIDWKMNLVKALFKWKQFQNPSDKLDKKFSVAAAKACVGEDKEIKTDHEADAICIASLRFVPGY